MARISAHRNFGTAGSRRTKKVGRAVITSLLVLGGLSALTRTAEAGASPPLLGAVADVSVGTQHACAVTPQGKLRCWGQNGFTSDANGRLGDGTGTNSSLPVGVVGVLRVIVPRAQAHVRQSPEAPTSSKDVLPQIPG